MSFRWLLIASLLSNASGFVQPWSLQCRHANPMRSQSRSTAASLWMSAQLSETEAVQAVNDRISAAPAAVAQSRASSTLSEDEYMFGSVRFSREGAVRADASEQRDLLLFLPGVDGLSVEVAAQLNPLSEHFDTWCLTLGGDDRTSFPGLVDAVVQFLEQRGASPDRKAVIAGSSFGGTLSLAVSLRAPQLIKGLAIVNAATSYERSLWPVLGNALTLAPNKQLFSAAATAALIATLPDTEKRETTIADISALPLIERPAAVAKLIGEYAGLLSSVFNVVSPESLRYRLRAWLRAGAAVVNSQLDKIQVPVLLLAGNVVISMMKQYTKMVTMFIRYNDIVLLNECPMHHH
jgi:pimeloyl-ACP methyl ester carboxylesterase